MGFFLSDKGTLEQRPRGSKGTWYPQRTINARALECQKGDIRSCLGLGMGDSSLYLLSSRVWSMS